MRLALGSRVFAPSLLATLLLVPVLAVLVWLGSWQLERAADKRALLRAFEVPSGAPLTLGASSAARQLPRYARVTLSGRYRPQHQFLLDNMTHQGAVGYRVVTPFATADGALVLVDRGWVPLGASRAALPPVAVGEDARTVTGRIDELPRAGLTLKAVATSGWPRVLNYPSAAELEGALGERLHPGLVLLDADAADGYLREWRPGGFPPERHVGYALQWFALAVTLFAGYTVASLRPLQ